MLISPFLMDLSDLMASKISEDTRLMNASAASSAARATPAAPKAKEAIKAKAEKERRDKKRFMVSMSKKSMWFNNARGAYLTDGAAG